MSDRGSRSPKERASAVKGTKVPRQPDDKQRRVSRAEREAKRQKQLRWGVGIAAVAVLAVLLGFATWDYIIKPRQVLATVDGSRIRREDYWKFRKLELYQQMTQYSQFSQMVGDQQQAQQYQSLALQAQAQLGSVWGSTDVNDQTLQMMIDNQIYVQSLDEFNITISDEELETWTLNQFAPADAPLIEPTITPTFVPERADWATQTAEALIPTTEITPTVLPSDSTPIGGATPILEATPIASPDDGTPAASPIAGLTVSPIASPDVDGATPIAESTPIGSPAADASPIATVEPTPTISAEQSLATAETSWDAYQSTVLDQANMSVDDYYRLTARPQLAQQKIRDALTTDIGQTADQVHARHILVATQELADQLYTDISNGTQDFAAVAAQTSTDTATAPNGGDLGWFPRGVMVDVFEEVAFNTEPGQVAPPVQSRFGWHIIQVIETQANRAFTDDQIAQLQQAKVQNWLTERQQQLSISSVMAPTPTPASVNFVPPVDAPPVPTATAFPEQTFEPVTPAASPVVSDSGSPVASPETVIGGASPVASPMATESASPAAMPAGAAATPEAVASTPEATPGVTASASPMASPVSSTAATPVASPIVADVATPVASPASSPVPVPAATSAAVVTAATPAPDVPVASPVTEASVVSATPDPCVEATPVASPLASPAASPSASPVASPTACATP